jgi:serine/threonine protein kinase
MAPEVLREEKYGRSCDVWSLGVILYRMFLGILPWELTDTHKSEMKVLTSIDKNPIKMNKKLP